jgi:hypothetical protein
MKSLINQGIAKVLGFIGVTITRTGSGILRGKKIAPSTEDRFKWIQNMNIKTVVDVGAHHGESAMQFHELFPNARIYSFEPLPDCFIHYTTE